MGALKFMLRSKTQNFVGYLRATRFDLVKFGLLINLVLSSNAAIGEQMKEEFKRMQPCPASPNCVSSLTEIPSKYIQPLRSQNEAGLLIDAIVGLLQQDASFSIVVNEAGYVRAEARTRLFRFVDDLEFQIRLNSGYVDIRSGSRMGFSDLGKNRRRMEALRRNLIHMQAVSPE